MSKTNQQQQRAKTKFDSMGTGAEQESDRVLVSRLSHEIGVDGYARLSVPDQIFMDDVRYKLQSNRASFGAKQVAHIKVLHGQVVKGSEYGGG